MSLTLNRAGGVGNVGWPATSGVGPGGAAFVGEGNFGSVAVAGGTAFSNPLSPTTASGGTGGRGQRDADGPDQSASAGGAGAPGYIVISLY